MYYSVENAFIAPHLRPGYNRVENYPDYILIGHSTAWSKIINGFAKKYEEIKVTGRYHKSIIDEIDFTFLGIPIRYAYAPEGTIGLQTEIVKHSMRGAGNIINIGCAGAIHSDLKLGNLVLAASAIRDSGFGKHFVTEDETLDNNSEIDAEISDTIRNFQGEAIKANVWCVDTLYYNQKRLNELIENGNKPDIVEMELEAGIITTNWLNNNYFTSKQLNYSHISYISDHIHINQNNWDDPFQSMYRKNLIRWKKKAFMISLISIANLNKNKVSQKKLKDILEVFKGEFDRIDKHILH